MSCNTSAGKKIYFIKKWARRHRLAHFFIIGINVWQNTVLKTNLPCAIEFKISCNNDYIQISILKNLKNRKNRVMARTILSVFSLKSFWARLPSMPPTNPPIMMAIISHISGR